MSEVTIEIPVLWNDMDAAQHVNNLIYLKWCESSRIAYFESFGVDTDFQGGIGPILSYQDCKYIFPMTYPDMALISCSLHEMKSDRFILKSVVNSQKHERIAAISYQTIVPYDYKNLKKADVPKAWLKRMTE